jgi:hypothetical protein
MEVHKEQAAILKDMARITRMRRGRLTEQYNRKKAEDGTERRWGPYYTLQAWVGGRNRSGRIPSEVVPAVRQDIQNYAAFRELSDRYIQLAEGIAEAEMPDSKKKPRRCKLPSVGKLRSS